MTLNVSRAFEGRRHADPPGEPKILGANGALTSLNGGGTAAALNLSGGSDDKRITRRSFTDAVELASTTIEFFRSRNHNDETGLTFHEFQNIGSTFLLMPDADVSSSSIIKEALSMDEDLLTVDGIKSNMFVVYGSKRYEIQSIVLPVILPAQQQKQRR